MGGYVFIRYMKQDKNFADQLAADLQSAGVEVWGVQSIEAGQDWGKALKNAIADAEVFIFVSSRYAAESKLIGEDLRLALDNNIPVIPVVLDFPGFRHMPRPLYGIDWVDFRKDREKAFQLLLERIPSAARQTQPITAKTTQSRGYVFISYAEEDTAFVLQLRQFLRERGYSYWDYQESNRDYHNQLFLELEDVIREAAATLSVLSPDWRASVWAPKEYMFSQQVETPVFLLQAREMEPTLLTMGVPYIDFVQDVAKGFERLEVELKRKGLL